MKLNYKNLFLSIGINILLCSVCQANGPIFISSPNLPKIVCSVINVKKSLQKALSHANYVASAIVSIQSNRDGDVTQTSGFLITDNGYILTNYLHLKDVNSITVTLFNGKIFPATLIQMGNSDLDAAIIKIDATKLPYLELDMPSKSLSNWIFSIGAPISGNHLITVGTLTEKTTSNNISVQHIQSDSLHSGSPLFDLEGSLIGMHIGSYPIGKKKFGASLDKGFAIPLSVLREKKNQIENPIEASTSDELQFLIYSRHYKCLQK